MSNDDDLTEQLKANFVKDAIDNLVNKDESVWNSDEVNSPSHYKTGDIECIQGIKASTGEHYVGYLQGNIIKYIWRFQYKGNEIKDLEKAQWYLKELLSYQKSIKYPNYCNNFD